MLARLAVSHDLRHDRSIIDVSLLFGSDFSRSLPRARCCSRCSGRSTGARTAKPNPCLLGCRPAWRWRRRGGRCSARTWEEEPRSGERASSVCVWLSARCMVRRSRQRIRRGGGAGREVEEAVEHGATGRERERELGSNAREDGGGRVSIPAIMPGAHAHMGPYARDQPRSDRWSGWELALHHHKIFSLETTKQARRTHCTAHGRPAHPGRPA